LLNVYDIRKFLKNRNQGTSDRKVVMKGEKNMKFKCNIAIDRIIFFEPFELSYLQAVMTEGSQTNNSAVLKERVNYKTRSGVTSWKSSDIRIINPISLKAFQQIFLSHLVGHRFRIII